MEDLATAQAKRGHQVRVLTIDRDLVGGDPRRLAAHEIHRGVDVLRVPAVGTSRKQFATGSYDDILTSLRTAAVVHHHDPRFLFELTSAVRRLGGRPVIFHTHGLIWHTDRFAALKQLVSRWYYGPMLRHVVDVVIADSDADADRLAASAHVDGAKVRVLRNAIDLTRFAEIRRAPQDGLIASYGRLDTHKGLDRLLAALPEVELPWRLEVAGTGPDDLVQRLAGMARSLGIADRVTWLGRISDDALDGLLARAALLAFPSRSEGFGLALLETLAAGAPVLASDIPSHREVLGPGLLDRLADFEDPSELASRISAALAAPEDPSIGERARARAATFGHNDLVDALEGIYAELGLRPATQSASTSTA